MPLRDNCPFASLGAGCEKQCLLIFFQYTLSRHSFMRRRIPRRTRRKTSTLLHAPSTDSKQAVQFVCQSNLRRRIAGRQPCRFEITAPSLRWGQDVWKQGQLIFPSTPCPAIALCDGGSCCVLVAKPDLPPQSIHRLEQTRTGMVEKSQLL